MEQCLYAVTAALQGIAGEVIVVDNGSTDGSRAYFEKGFPGVRFIFSEENLGFARANNLALKEAQGEYILFLNPDTIVAEDSFRKCLDFFGSKEDAGALGVKMIDGNGRFLKESKRAFPDPKTSLYKLSGLTSLFPRSKVFARYYLGHLGEDAIHEVEVLAGAFMMVKRHVLDVTGGFDEDFFMYGEDIDLSYRIREAGFRNYYFPETVIIHFKGESTKKGSIDYVKMFYKAMSVFAKKHYGGSRSGFFNFFIQTGIFFRGILSGLKRGLQSVAGLVLLDVLVILLSFGIIRAVIPSLGGDYATQNPNTYWNFWGIYVLVYMLCAFLWDVYERGFWQRRLNQAFLQSIILLWGVFIVLPDRFSVLTTSVGLAALLSFLIISIARKVLTLSGTIPAYRKLSGMIDVVVGAEEDLAALRDILHQDGEPDLGIRIVELKDVAERKPTRRFHFFTSPETRRILFCLGSCSYREVINFLPHLPSNTIAAFFTRGCQSVISGRGDGQFI